MTKLFGAKEISPLLSFENVQNEFQPLDASFEFSPKTTKSLYSQNFGFNFFPYLNMLFYRAKTYGSKQLDC